MSEYKIIDISGWNDNLSYSQIKSLGITAAILRITQKNNKKDTLFDTHINGLKNNNIPILGGYKFSYAMSIAQLKQQANDVIKVLNNYPEFKNKVVFLDLEYNNQKTLGKTMLTQFVNTFREIILNAGYKFAIYCNTDWYNNYLNTNSLPYDYWLAAYPYNDNGTIVEKLRPNKKGQVGWQYTSSFAIGNNRCDMSVFNKQYIDNILNNIPQQEIKPFDPIESSTSFMERIAIDNSHGYSQDSRWGNPDYDCSSLVIFAWEQAGIPVKTAGATYTGNMYNVFLKWGFKDVTNQVNLSTGAGMKRGDVLLNHVHHTAMYCGNGQEVEASINEKGGAHGGQPGDQTGREILIRSYRNYPWDAVLRYDTDQTSTLLKEGSKGSEVETLQIMLITCGYSCGSYGADGDFGKATKTALQQFQKDFKLEIDGIYGPQSKKILTEEYKKYPKTMKLIKKGYLRQGPSSKQPLIKTINKNTILKIESKAINKAGNTWYKIKNENGYISAGRMIDV